MTSPDETMTRRNLALGIVLMILAVFLFPLKDAFVKMTEGYYSAVLIIWTQFLFTGVIFLLLTLVREGPGGLVPRPFGLQLLRGLFVLVGMGAFYWAIALIPLAEATAMQFIAPLVVTVFSPMVLKEKIGIRRWASVSVGFLGVVIIIRPEFAGEPAGYLIAIVSGISIGLFFILNRKLAPHATPIASVAYSAVLGAIIVTPFIPSVWVPPRPEDFLLITGFVIVSLLGQICMFTAFLYGEASVVSPFHFIQIVGATLFGYLFFNEFPEISALIGIAVIILSGVYIVIREAKNARPSPG